MTTFLKGLLLYSFLALSAPVFSQRPTIKFGDIKPSDFSATAYAVDSSASGVVLYDVGSSQYEGSNDGGFAIIYKRHTRIRLLNRNSFDMASITIPLYAAGTMEERIESLEAVTYNLENGKIETYKLDKNSIFKDRLNKNYTVRKFTLPNLKEGSIIEIKYALKSPYERDLRSWYFQGNYPVLWSEYNVEIPTVYDFVIVNQGYHPFAINEGKTGHGNYNIIYNGSGATDRTERYNFSTTTSIQTWAMKDVPTLKQENFTTTLDNHIAKIDFQLSKIRYPDTEVKDVMSNWYKVSETLLKDPDFGESITKANGWVTDELKKITAGAATPLEAARKIYEYIRDNISCTSHSGKYLSGTLKKVYQTKSGNVADINLLLTTFLLNNGLDAHPVLLSTRAHGKALTTYPIMDQLNYVISQVKINDKDYLLDASHNRLGFGHLASECYNGYARIIDKDNPVLVDLSADSLKENKLTTVFMIADEKGDFIGTSTSTLGNLESNSLRERLAKTSKDEFFKETKKAYSSDVEISNTSIDSLSQYEEPVTIKYDIKFHQDDEMIYLNPVFGEAYKENPFKAAERVYPVEMPFVMNESYILKLDIPKGYNVEELPKSARVNFNENEGSFEYIIAHDAASGSIQLRSTLRLKKANFLPEDYQGLRDFFGYIVKKHSEQVVLKKIK